MSDNRIENFYDKAKKYITKYPNPNYDQHHLKVPFRMLLCGASGAGKTNTLMNILSRMSGTFEHITVCVKSADEPLYKLLNSKIPDDKISFFEDGEVPELTTLDKDKSHIIIFDDLVLEGPQTQERIAQYYIRGRKYAKGCSMVYLTQSYYRTPKTIRVNVNYLILKKLASQRDLAMILSEVSLDVSKDKLIEIYKRATDNHLDFLLIDVDSEAEKRFRHNLLLIIDPYRT